MLASLLCELKANVMELNRGESKTEAYSNNEKTNKVTWIQIARTIYFNRCLVEPTCSQGGLLLKIPNLGGLHPILLKHQAVLLEKTCLLLEIRIIVPQLGSFRDSIGQT